MSPTSTPLDELISTPLSRAARRGPLGITLEGGRQRELQEPPTTLAELLPQQCGELVAVEGARSFRRRLLELGLVPGTQVRLIAVAPLGDPLELEVRACRLSIRREEARMLRVIPQKPSSRQDNA
jgi:ferrous iron transport protein A